MTPRFFCAALALVGLAVTAACATGSASTTEDPADATPDDAAPTPTGTVPRDASAPESGGEASTQGLRRPGAGEVVFTEMMINPDGVSDEFGEWVELYNTTDTPLGLAQCRLSDESSPKDDREIDRDVVVPAKSAIVLGRSASAAANGGLSGVTFEYGNGFVLANTGDSAILTCNGVVVDRVDFTSTWPFGKGVTMQVKQSARNATANDTPGNWCLATLSFGTGAQKGTPGNTQNHCP
jgi:hypothetical protein